MYAISNLQYEELIILLAALKVLPDRDDKTTNIKRRANIMIKKLAKAKQVSYKQIKDKM